MKVSIELKFQTDGDFDFKNDDLYFKKEIGKDLYLKRVIIEQNDINKELELIFQEMKERIFNKYNQKDGLIKIIQKLTPFKTAQAIDNNLEFDVDAEKIFSKRHWVNIEYLSGNHEIDLQIRMERELSEHSLLELIQKIQESYGLRVGQIFENIRSKKGCLFQFSDENLKKEIIELIEKPNLSRIIF